MSLCTVALIHVTSKINMNIKVFFKKKTTIHHIHPSIHPSLRLQLLQLLHRCDVKLLNVGFALESHVYDTEPGRVPGRVPGRWWWSAASVVVQRRCRRMWSLLFSLPSQPAELSWRAAGRIHSKPHISRLMSPSRGRIEADNHSDSLSHLDAGLPFAAGRPFATVRPHLWLLKS